MVSKYHYCRLSVFVCFLHLQPPHFNLFTYLRVWSWLLKFNLPSSSSFYGDIIGSTAGSPTGSWPPDGVGRKPLFEDGCRHLKYRRNVSVDIYLYHVNKCLSEKINGEQQSFCMTKCENWCLQLNVLLEGSTQQHFTPVSIITFRLNVKPREKLSCSLSLHGPSSYRLAGCFWQLLEK